MAAPVVPVSPAGAEALIPLVDCIQDAPLGSVTSRTVVLGYRSSAAALIAVAPGAGGNDFTAGAPDRGQPSSFEPGEHHGVWLVTVDAAVEPDLAWRLGTTEARFDAAPSCTGATTVTVSAPASAQTGGTVPVTATVSRMLLGAPGTGEVVFTVDDASTLAVPVSPGGVARADLPVTAPGQHTITASYRPADGSGLLPSSGSTTVVATAPSAPLAVATDSVVAGTTSVLVTVERPSSAGVARVDVMTADGTARAGSDYTGIATTVTLVDGQAFTTVSVPLAKRPAGSPSATFFVLLQRASTPVAVASAAVTLPAVPPSAAAAASSSAAGGGHGGPIPAASSVLPPSDPTASAAAPSARAAQDLAMMIGGVLLTVGGVLGVVGLVRAAGMRGARA